MLVNFSFVRSFVHSFFHENLYLNVKKTIGDKYKFCVDISLGTGT